MQTERVPTQEAKDKVRRLVADALDYAGIVDHSGASVRKALVDDGAPVELTSLRKDSLGIMEACIYLEGNTGLLIEPATFLKVQTLDQLVDLIIPQLP